MKVTDLGKTSRIKVEMEGAEKAWKQLVLSSSDGAPNFSFRVFTVEPGGHTPLHTHESEHLNYIIQGEGALVDSEGTERRIAAGNFALVLPGEKHQYRNTGSSEDLILICAVPSQYE
ncbi:MAG: cupin domain-containing protein [Verrucomicrobiota bacterium]